VPDAAGQTGGYVFVNSSVPLYGVGMVGANNFAFLAGTTPIRMPDGFNLPASTVAPSIIGVTSRASNETATDVLAGTSLRIVASNAPNDSAFVFGSRSVTPEPFGPGLGVFYVDVPAVEPGFVKMKIRTASGLESAPITLHVL